MNGYPRGVEVVTAGFVRNADGKFLFIQSPKWGDYWLNAGGHVDAGESLEKAVEREVFEETGLTVRAVHILRMGELISSPDFHRPSHMVFAHVLCDVVSGQLRTDPREISTAKWMTLDEALSSKIPDDYPETIGRLRRYQAAEEAGVRPGVYEHYKGNRYRVEGIAFHSETKERLVIYQALYGDRGMWVRPLSMFCETVDVGGRRIPRFRFLGPDQDK